MFGQIEQSVLSAFGEYHVKLLERLREKLSVDLIDRFVGGYSDVPEDEDIIVYTMMLTGMRITGGKWRGRGVATLRAKDILTVESDSVHFWVPRGPNKVTDAVIEDSLLADLFGYLTSGQAFKRVVPFSPSGENRLFRTTYTKVLDRFYEYEKELNGTETFIPWDIRRLIATCAAFEVMGRKWDDAYKFDVDATLPNRSTRVAVITGNEDL